MVVTGALWGLRACLSRSSASPECVRPATMCKLWGLYSSKRRTTPSSKPTTSRPPALFSCGDTHYPSTSDMHKYWYYTGNRDSFFLFICIVWYWICICERPIFTIKLTLLSLHTHLKTLIIITLLKCNLHLNILYYYSILAYHIYTQYTIYNVLL